MPIKRLDENLVKEQMRTIDKLQEKIKLQLFDITQLNRENRELRFSLKRQKENIKNIRKKLEQMKKENDFSKINSVLIMLNERQNEEYD